MAISPFSPRRGETVARTQNVEPSFFLLANSPRHVSPLVIVPHISLNVLAGVLPDRRMLGVMPATAGREYPVTWVNWGLTYVMWPWVSVMIMISGLCSMMRCSRFIASSFCLTCEECFDMEIL